MQLSHGGVKELYAISEQCYAKSPKKLVDNAILHSYSKLVNNLGFCFMGKLSGRPGPDPLSFRDEDQEEDDFFRKIGIQNVVYSVVNRVKLTEFDQEGHGEMLAMIPKLEELGFAVTQEQVDMDYSIDDEGRSYRRWTSKRVSRADIISLISKEPGKTAEEYSLILYQDSDHPLPKPKLDLAKNKFRQNITYLKREGIVKARYDTSGVDGGIRSTPRYYLTTHHTNLSKTPGGQIREVPPPGQLLEDNVTRAVEHLRATLAALGASPALASIETGILDDEGHRVGAEPAFLRENIKKLYSILVGKVNQM